jgi:hypothetical protein
MAGQRAVSVGEVVRSESIANKHESTSAREVIDRVRNGRISE